MRAMFWRRKNAQLEERLDTVIEVSERVRQSFRPKTPRTAIDTTYLESGPAAEPLSPHDDVVDERALMPDEPGPVETQSVDPDEIPYDTETLWEIASQLDEQLQLEQEAREKAEKKCAEAVRSASEAQAKLSALEGRSSESRASNETLKLAGGGADKGMQVADDLREQLAELEIEVEQLQAARRAADKQCDEAVLRAAESERKLVELQDAAEQTRAIKRNEAKARAREEDALKEAEAQRSRAEELEEELTQAHAARQDVEQEITEAARRAEDALMELSELRAAADEELAAVRSSEEDARAREEAALLDAQSHLERVTQLEEDLRNEQTAHRDSEAQHEEERIRADKAELELCELRETVEAFELREREAEDALKECDTLREQLASLEGELLKEQEAKLDMASQREEAVLRADEYQAKLIELREATDARELQEKADREAQEREEITELQEQIARLESELLQEEERRLDIDSQRAEAVLRADEFERKLTDLRDATDARELSEKADREAQEGEELIELREQIARLESDLLQEEERRLDIDSQRAEAVLRADEFEQKLADLREATDARELSEKADREAQEGEELIELREQIARLESNLLQEEERRLDIDSQRAEAVLRADESEQKLADLREATDERVLSEKADREAQEGEELTELREQIARLESDLLKEEEHRLDIDSQREEAVLRADEFERKLAELREELSDNSNSAQDDELVRLREDLLVQQELAERLAADIESEQVARQEADERCAELDHALADLRLELTVAQTQAGSAANGEDAHKAAGEDEPGVPLEDSDAQSENEDEREPETPVADDQQLEALAGSGKELVPSDTSVKEHVSAPDTSTNPPVKSADPKNKRFERRVSSQIAGSLVRKGMTQPLTCIVRDRSPGGARLEYTTDKFFSAVQKPSVGDRMVLTLNNARERTALGCTIVWTTANGCGVRFSGQFHTQVNHPKKPMRSKATEKKSKAGRLAKAVFSGLGR